MMTIDEAIKRYEDVAEKQRSKAYMYDDMMVYNQTIKHNSEAEYYEELMNECYRWVEEHRQFAEWLRELKKYRAIFEKFGKILADNGYTIDDLDTIFGKVNEEVNTDE